MAALPTPGPDARWRALATPWLLPALGLVAMYGPSFFDLLNGIWRTDEQGHGPIVLGISIWLLVRA